MYVCMYTHTLALTHTYTRTHTHTHAHTKYTYIYTHTHTHTCVCVGDLPMALRVLEAYESTLEEFKSPDYEHSEMLLYKNLIIQEQGNDKAF